MFETLRRLLLTGGQIILNPGTPSQIVLNLIICMFSMNTYKTYMPFNSTKANKLAEITQWQLFFTMLAALCIKVDISEEDNYNKRMFDLCLSGLQLTGPVLLVYQGFVQGGAKGAVLNTEVGGAMDDVRAMARSYSDAKGAAKELGGLGGSMRQLRAMSSGFGKSFRKADLGGGGGQGEERLDAARRKWGGDGEGEGVEMRGNPLHEGAAGDNGFTGDVDQRHLFRAKSGGYHNKPTQGGGRLGKKTGGDNAKLPEAAAAPPPPPAKETTWVQHVDEKSGHPFYESSAGESSWDEPFAREGGSWRSLVDGRVVYEEPQNVI